MKKIKLLPSILMLVACIALLGVGVYAISPTQNKITGTLTINGANTPVKIELLVNGILKETHNEVRGGINWDLSNIAFNTASVNSVDEVSPIVLTIRISNLSTSQGLGAYFFDQTSTLTMEDEKSGETITHYGGTAKAENILLETEIFAKNADKTDANKIADVWFTPYAYIAKNDGITTGEELDVVEMNVNLKCFQLPDSSISNDLNFQLNIEPYYSNIAKEDIKKASYEVDFNECCIRDTLSCNTVFSNALLKLPEDLTQMPVGAFYGKEIDHIVFSAPISFEMVYMDDFDSSSYAFGDCDVKGVSYSGKTSRYGSGAGAPYYLIEANCISYNATTIENSFFTYMYGNYNISFTSNLKELSIDYYYSSIGELTLLSTTPPVIYYSEENSFNKIYIPTGSLEAYKNAEGWSGYSDKLVELSIA